MRSKTKDPRFSGISKKRPKKKQCVWPEFCVPRQTRAPYIFRPSSRVPLKEHCAGVREISRPLPSPIRKVVPLYRWKAMDFFNALRKCLVVCADSVAPYLLTCPLTILSLSMGSESLIAFATSLKTVEYNHHWDQIATSSSAENSIREFR